jgi:hypothetical protein
LRRKKKKNLSRLNQHTKNKTLCSNIIFYNGVSVWNL